MNQMARNLLLLALVVSRSTVLAEDWPQWRGENRAGVWKETGIVAELPKELRFKWRKPIGLGYAGPAVVGNRVFVMDRQLGEGQTNPDNPFDKPTLEGNERVLCFDADTGELVWEHKYACAYTISYAYGPRVTPTVVDGKVYTVGAMGDFWCLDAETGKVLWSRKYQKDYGTTINTWGMASHPLVDEKLVYLLVAGSAGVVALDRETGAEVWKHPIEGDDPGYAPPIKIEAGGTTQLIVWTPTGLYGIDPKTGKSLWSQEFPLNFSLSISQPIHDPQRQLLFVTSFYNGPMMMKLSDSSPTASLLWKGKSNSEKKTDGLHSIMSTPIMEGGYIYGVCSFGQLRCLRAETGERLWETFEATGDGRWWNAFLVKHGDRTVIANEQGDLIFAKLSPEGYQESSRAHLIEPTQKAMRREIVWSHPAFARRCVFARNDREIVCADLSE